MKTRIVRTAAVLASAALMGAGFTAPAVAGNSTSKGHGVKCTWVLVSSVGGVNTYKQVCRKGV